MFKLIREKNRHQNSIVLTVNSEQVYYSIKQDWINSDMSKLLIRNMGKNKKVASFVLVANFELNNHCTSEVK